MSLWLKPNTHFKRNGGRVHIVHPPNSQEIIYTYSHENNIFQILPTNIAGYGWEKETTHPLINSFYILLCGDHFLCSGEFSIFFSLQYTKSISKNVTVVSFLH